MITSKIKFIITISIVLFSNFGYSKYIPDARYSTSCISDNNIVYFIGGLSQDSRNCLNDFFYLNLSDLNTQPSFEELTSTPAGYCWSSSSFAEGGKKIYAFGGTNDTLIYSYDINSQLWSIPKIDGIAPETRGHFQSVSDNEKNFVYIFGGQVTGTNVKFFNDMNILSTKYSSWYNMMILGAQKIINPPYWADFTATMLSSGEIVYIGGRQSTSPSGKTVTFAKMNEIYVFNTKSSSWDIINATGNSPSPRIGHSAVLSSNNQIIIYGGTSSEDWTTPAIPDLVILSVTSKPYQWTTPQVGNQQPQSRSFHSAAIVGTSMIIAFGRITGTQSVTNTFNILNMGDTTNFSWMSYSTAESDTELKDLKQTFLTQNLAIILGSTIGGVVVLVVITVIVVLLYKSWKSNRNMGDMNHMLQLPSSQNS